MSRCLLTNHLGLTSPSLWLPGDSSSPVNNPLFLITRHPHHTVLHGIIAMKVCGVIVILTGTMSQNQHGTAKGNLRGITSLMLLGVISMNSLHGVVLRETLLFACSVLHIFEGLFPLINNIHLSSTSHPTLTTSTDFLHGLCRMTFPHATPLSDLLFLTDLIIPKETSLQIWDHHTITKATECHILA